MSEPLPYPAPPDQPPEPDEWAENGASPGEPGAEVEQAAAERPLAVPAAPATPEPAPRADPQLPAPPPAYPPAYQAPPPPYPAYQSAPPAYSPYQAPVPSYGPPAGYAAPPYGSYAPPYGYSTSARRPSRNAWMAIIAGIVVAVLLLAVVGYGIAGYLVAQNEISIASNAITAVNSHRASITSSFDNLAQQMAAFDSTATASSQKSKAVTLVSQSQTLGSTVAGNAQALRSAQLKLSDLSWLTSFSRGSLQDESTRLDHARKAIADVQAAADDYRLLGGFLQSYFQVFVDLDNLGTANQNNDANGYVSAFTALRSDLATSLQLAAPVPGLPTAYHDQLSGLQAVANDIRQRDMASANGDTAGAAAAQKTLTADAQKVDAVDFSGASADFHAYYQRIRDDFSSQLDQATV